MRYAEICVNSPVAGRQTFSYAIPPSLNINAGQAVWVPFGEKLLQGIVLELSDYPAVPETREIADIIEPQPLLSPAQVLLAYWISRHYLSPLFDAVALMLPPGFGRKALTFISASISEDFDISSLGEEQRHALELIKEDGKISQKKLEKALGQKKAQVIVSQLVRRGLATRSYELEAIKIKPKLESYLNLAITTDQAEQEIAKSRERKTERQAALLEFLAQQSQPVYISDAKKAAKCDTSVANTLISKGLIRSFELESAKKRKKPKLYLSLLVRAEEARRIAVWLQERITARQAALLSFLAEQAEPVSLSEARQKTKCDKTTLNALVQKKLITVQLLEVRRNPLTHYDITPSSPLILTDAQQSALMTISQSLAPGEKKESKVFLLHGVTGSGKTEVYLQALAETVRLGKGGIVLVPEISLTPQTIERFASRFPNQVAILHSQLSPGEQFDEWHRISKGDCNVVIGPRSALFAPQPDLGLIIIDEEHEWSYKQSDNSPHYHARNTAIKLAELTGAVVILGSATPDVETFYHTQKGDYHLLQLPERVTPSQNSPLPQVEIVDLREELKAGNRSLFSRFLSQAITQAIASQEQVMLFLNRRGGATFIQCRNCGFVFRCRRCEVALTHHPDRNILVCHQCNYQIPVPQFCPRCSSQRIKFLGMGTQRLEQETGNVFPQARLLRWDSDTTREKHSHQEILNRFRDHQADILIGTQMINKGLDVPRVTLVGVVN
ncbi:MAG: primosomal protein N', partial [Chloroflexi bacterium]|nr:primosomal protein N' [Chloroflexota bacterium]